MNHARPGATAADLAAALIGRLQDDFRAAAHTTEQSSLQAIATVAQTAAGLRHDLAAYVTQRHQTDQELFGQLADLRTEQRQMRAVLDRLGTVNDQSHTVLAQEPAIRALIAVDEQLANVQTAVVGEHSAVVAGQRSNLRQTLDQLGARAIEPQHGATFEPNRHRSSSMSAPTDNANLHERVASLTRAGWELSDGRLLAPAEVVVYVYTPPMARPEPVVLPEEAAKPGCATDLEPLDSLQPPTKPAALPTDQLPAQPPLQLATPRHVQRTSASEQRVSGLDTGL